MAKKVALKFGKHSRIDWQRNLNQIREAIKTDDQFHLGIYATIFTKLPKVVKEYYPDPTDASGKFCVTDVKAKKKLKRSRILSF